MLAAAFRGIIVCHCLRADDVTLDFGVADAGTHYHVPLLAFPYSFSTYKGSWTRSVASGARIHAIGDGENGAESSAQTEAMTVGRTGVVDHSDRH